MSPKRSSPTAPPSAVRPARKPTARAGIIGEISLIDAGVLTPGLDPVAVKVAVITQAFDSYASLAEHLGVSRSQPGKWLSGQEQPNPRARRMIQDFDYVWSRLIDERSADVARLWLTSPNAFLDGATPMTWLRTRGAESVVAAIDAEEAGSFA